MMGLTQEFMGNNKNARFASTEEGMWAGVRDMIESMVTVMEGMKFVTIIALIRNMIFVTLSLDLCTLDRALSMLRIIQ